MTESYEEQPMKTAILNIGIDRPYLLRRHQILADAGFDVLDVTTPAEAETALQNPNVRLAIFGHRVPLDHRLAISAELKKRAPALRIVIMYDHSASKTEHADAVLQINVPPEDLVHTMQYLLSDGASSKALGFPC